MGHHEYSMVSVFHVMPVAVCVVYVQYVMSVMCGICVLWLLCGYVLQHARNVTS